MCVIFYPCQSRTVWLVISLAGICKIIMHFSDFFTFFTVASPPLFLPAVILNRCCLNYFLDAFSGSSLLKVYKKWMRLFTVLSRTFFSSKLRHSLLKGIQLNNYMQTSSVSLPFSLSQDTNSFSSLPNRLQEDRQMNVFRAKMKILQNVLRFFRSGPGR